MKFSDNDKTCVSSNLIAYASFNKTSLREWSSGYYKHWFSGWVDGYWINEHDYSYDISIGMTNATELRLKYEFIEVLEKDLTKLRELLK